MERFPELTGRRLWREIRGLGFEGGYSTVTEFLRVVRPAPPKVFERRFETPPGKQGQASRRPHPGQRPGQADDPTAVAPQEGEAPKQRPAEFASNA